MFKNETLIQHDSNVYQDVMLSSNGSILFYQIYNIKVNVLHFQYYFWDAWFTVYYCHVFMNITAYITNQNIDTL